MIGTINQKTIDWLESRNIDPEVAVQLGVYTANVSDMRGASVAVFPYIEDGVIVNEKFRMLPKQKFWQHSGRRKICYNADVLKDPGLESGQNPLVVTEGELDCIAAVQCGFKLAISVPDGAPPAGPYEENPDGSADQDGRYSWLWDDRHKFAKVKRFVLATDNDAPGIRLREELIRRLFASRCYHIEYPLGCKDLNDVLMKHGQTEVVKVINNAIPCPVHGVYDFSDYPEVPEVALSSGWSTLDRHFKLLFGTFIVVTGIPQHGKSSFVMQLMENIARLHGWRSAMFSPEMPPRVIRNCLRSVRTHKAAHLAGPETDAWINDMFHYIGYAPKHRVQEDDDVDFTLDWVLDRATEAVFRHGIRLLVIDPWNEVEHARHRNETTVDYIGRSIVAMKRFARAHNVVVLVVAHPTKMVARNDGSFPPPNLYDIADAAHWYNKCDHGIVVYRKPNGGSQIHVIKSRFEEGGEPGMVEMAFNRVTHRFDLLDSQHQPRADE